MKTATPSRHNHNVTDSLNDVADQVKDLVTENIEEKIGRIKQVRTQVSNRVKSNPLASVAIAAGVGLILGRFFLKK